MKKKRKDIDRHVRTSNSCGFLLIQMAITQLFHSIEHRLADTFDNEAKICFARCKYRCNRKVKEERREEERYSVFSFQESKDDGCKVLLVLVIIHRITIPTTLVPFFLSLSKKIERMTRLNEPLLT
jgi:hypothetical protein